MDDLSIPVLRCRGVSPSQLAVCQLCRRGQANIGGEGFRACKESLPRWHTSITVCCWHGRRAVHRTAGASSYRAAGSLVAGSLAGGFQAVGCFQPAQASQRAALP